MGQKSYFDIRPELNPQCAKNCSTAALLGCDKLRTVREVPYENKNI